MIEWTTVIVAAIGGFSVGLPALIVALKSNNVARETNDLARTTNGIVNGRMDELIEARAQAAAARAVLHERADRAHTLLLHEAAVAAGLVKETAAAAAAAATAKPVP